MSQKKLIGLTLLLLIAFNYHVMPIYAASDSVVLQLRWQHQFQFAGYYVADWNGYYEAEGLDVSIRSAFTDSGLVQATDEVLAGRAEFGIGASDILIAQDQSADLKLIASFFQKSPVEYYALAETPINSPLDFPSLNAARRPNDLLDIEYQVILQQEGMNPHAGKFVTMERDFTIEDLTSGRFDLVPGYLGKIPYFAAKHNIPLQRINAYQYGIDFYGDSLFTSAALAKRNPELVERFRRASIKGWLYALEHPEEVAGKIAATYPNFEDTLIDEYHFNLQQAEQIQALMLYPHVEIGNMNPYRWEKMSNTLNALGITKTQVSISQLIFDYEQLQHQQFKQTSRHLGVLLLSFFAVSIIFFILYLNIKNKRLRQEVDYRKTLENYLKLSNHRYETIFNSSVLGITLTDASGKIISHNATWCRMLGYTPDEMTTKNIQSLIYPEDLPIDREQRKALMSGEVPNYVTEKRYLHKSGALMWGKLFMTRIADINYELPLNMGMVIDITREIHESEALKKSEALILYQSRMAAMGEMIANIAHQWRQPLNALNLVFANLNDAFEADELSPQEMAEGQTKATRLIQKMSETIDDFRYFANPRTAPRHFELHTVIDTTAALLEAQLSLHQIQLETQIQLGIVLFGHDNQLSQALFNLISNSIDAVKTLPVERRKILLSATSRETHVDLEISDWGMGVPEAVAAQIFDIYFTTKTAEGGTGLGLHMSKTIVESIFGGQLLLAAANDTPKNIGATFKIKLPFYDAQKGDSSYDSP